MNDRKQPNEKIVTESQLRAVINYLRAEEALKLEWCLNDQPPYSLSVYDRNHWLKRDGMLTTITNIMKKISEDCEILFRHEDQAITYPFLDVSGRFEVNPVEYYGWDKIEPLLYNYLNNIDE